LIFSTYFPFCADKKLCRDVKRSGRFADWPGKGQGMDIAGAEEKILVGKFWRS